MDTGEEIKLHCPDSGSPAGKTTFDVPHVLSNQAGSCAQDSSSGSSGMHWKGESMQCKCFRLVQGSIFLVF